MKMINSFISAFSMFSKIPMPKIKWDSENMKYIYAFIPFIGLIISFLCFLFYGICIKYDLSSFTFSVGVIIINLLVTGLIHLDGFCDTLDALSSYKDKNQMLEIMKDSHIGSFAVIYVIIYFLFTISMYMEIYLNYKMLFFSLISFVFSRLCASFLQFFVKNAKKEGLSYTFNKDKNYKTVIFLFTYLILIFLYCFDLKLVFLFISMLLFQIVFTIFFVIYINKKIGGITGDISGFYICMTEAFVLFFAFLGGIL